LTNRIRPNGLFIEERAVITYKAGSLDDGLGGWRRDCEGV